MMRIRTLGALALAVCALGALPAAGWANVQVGSSGWQWGNPLPQGNQINALAFAGAQGYAVGDFGTLLSSADGGATWTGRLSGTFANLTEIQTITPTSIFAGGGCVGRRSDDGGATFKRVAFTPVESSCRQGLAAAWWLSPNTGYIALADGTVLRTDNGGDTFAQKNPVPGGAPADMVFLNDTVGIAAGAGGKIYRTTDGATSWVQAAATDRSLRAFRFLDGATGYAVGDGSIMLKTTDAGASWTAVPLGLAPRTLTSITCSDIARCIMTGDNSAEIVHVTGLGGCDTPPCPAPTVKLVTPSPDVIRGAAFAEAGRVVVAGATGSTAISSDGGSNFAPVGGRLTGTFNRVVAGGQANTAFAPGDNGTLAKTVDGGANWTRGNVSTSEDVRDVSFPNANAGFALDDDGGLFRTNDGGATWRTLDTGTTADPTEVMATSPSTVLLVGPTGVRRSSNGGDSFNTVRDRAVRGRTEVIDRAGSGLVVYDAGGTTLVRSTNGGRDWAPIPGPRSRRGVNRTRIRQADFVSPRRGFLIDATGRLWSTSNGGRRWQELPSVGTEDASGISFSSGSSGFLVIPEFGAAEGPSGFLLRTADGGRTFRPQFVVSQGLPEHGIAATSGRDYLIGGESSLLFSTTGGDAGASSTLSITTPRRTLPRRRRINVTGRLSPSQANEEVTVSYRAPGSTRWQHQTVRTASNGAYTTSWRVRRGTNVFVAQWQGNFRNRGAGTRVLTVRARR
jgi:photosystem II stability/assembly factor-like uncharacterized protein